MTSDNEALRNFVLDYWNKYYDDWANIEIPLLDNKTPSDTIKTKKAGKE